MHAPHAPAITPPRPPRKAPRRSPAVNTVRPLLLASAGLGALGWLRDAGSLLIAAGAVAFAAGLVLVVVHASHRRRVEREGEIRCG